MTREEAAVDIEQNILPIVGGVSLRMAVMALRELDRRDKEDIKAIQEAVTYYNRRKFLEHKYGFCSDEGGEEE